VTVRTVRLSTERWSAVDTVLDLTKVADGTTGESISTFTTLRTNHFLVSGYPEL